MEDKSDNNTDNPANGGPANGGIDKHLALFSKLAIDVLKELASKGEGLTPESLLLAMRVFLAEWTKHCMRQKIRVEIKWWF